MKLNDVTRGTGLEEHGIANANLIFWTPITGRRRLIGMATPSFPHGSISFVGTGSRLHVSSGTRPSRESTKACGNSSDSNIFEGREE